MELPSFYKIFFPRPRPAQPGRQFDLGSGCCMWIISLIALGTPAQAYTLLQLKQEIASFLTEQYTDPRYERVEINVNSLDKRLRIGYCDQPLTMDAKDPSGLGGNLTVNVQCNGKPAWSVHLPAQVHIFASIPIASRALIRGNLVKASDITQEVTNISLIRQAFFTSPEAAIGKEVKRNIGPGEPLRKANLDAPTVIKRGDPVALSASIGGISVATTGTAMGQGRIGQKIRIRNNQSNRIISARVTGPGQAQTE